MTGTVDNVIYNIEGEHVALGPIRHDLLPTYQRWINDFATLRTLGGVPRPMTMESEARWYESATSAQSVPFTIYEKDKGHPIGTTSLGNIDRHHRTAELGILIGDPGARGKGYGTETTRLMLDYAFTALGLNSLFLKVAEFNLAGRHAYEKAGFKVIGRRRQGYFMGGRFWDDIFMDCLASEFESSVLGGILAPDEERPRPDRN